MYRMLSLEIASILPPHWAFLTSFKKIPILFQYLFMKKLLISSKSFISLTSTTNFLFLRLDHVFQLVNTSSVIFRLEFVFSDLCLTAARICSLCRSRTILICSLSELWLGISLTFGICESNGFTTGLPVLSWLTDDDWLDDKPSSWEW